MDQNEITPEEQESGGAGEKEKWGKREGEKMEGGKREGKKGKGGFQRAGSTPVS